MSRGRFDGLEGLRGIAALCVFIGHVFPDLRIGSYIAVDFFFMLSGYVMARSSEARLGNTAGARSFMAARIRRLCPMVFLSGLFALPWLLEQRGSGPLFIAACLALPVTINSPAWSIGAELFANGVHATVLARLNNRMLACVGALLCVLLVETAWRHGLDLLPFDAALWKVGLRVLVPYIGGILLYRSWRDVPPIAVNATFTWLALPTFIAVTTLRPEIRGIADLMFMILLCPLLIAGGLQRGQGSRIARALGAYSFPLYACHGPAILGLMALGFDWPLRALGGLGAGLVMMVLAGRRSGTGPRRRRVPTPDALPDALPV